MTRSTYSIKLFCEVFLTKRAAGIQIARVILAKCTAVSCYIRGWEMPSKNTILTM